MQSYFLKKEPCEKMKNFMAIFLTLSLFRNFSVDLPYKGL